jgi:hypothetical protein
LQLPDERLLIGMTTLTLKWWVTYKPI